MLVARLARLTLSYLDGTWRLSQPTVVEQRDQDFVVDRLSIGNNGRQFFLDDASLCPGVRHCDWRSKDLTYRVIRVFFPEGPDITGILSAQGQLGGTQLRRRKSIATMKLDNFHKSLVIKAMSVWLEQGVTGIKRRS